MDAQTAGRITKVWDTLDPSTTLALVNTVYLKADWLNYFLEDPVTQDPFTRTGGSAVTVSMMHQSRMSTRYWAGPGGWLRWSCRSRTRTVPRTCRCGSSCRRPVVTQWTCSIQRP